MRSFTTICIVTLISLSQIAAAGEPAAPELTVRMGQYNIANDEKSSEEAGTHLFEVQVGETRLIKLLFRNSGVADLKITVPAVLNGPDSAQFSVLFGPDNLLEPGAEAFTILAYTPTSPGNHHATFRLESNDPDESPFVINLEGEAQNEPPDVAPVDLALPGDYTLKSKCNLKKGLCTANGKVTVHNLAPAPSVLFAWFLVSPYEDGSFDGSSEVVANGITKKIKAHKGFPAPFPRKKVKFKAGSPPPGDTRFVLLILPLEEDLDWSNNSCLLELPL